MISCAFWLFGVRVRLYDSEHVAGWILCICEPADFRDRHFRNADFAAALLDLSDGLIKRRNRDCVQRAGTLTFSRAREPTIDSRLLVITGSDQPIFHRSEERRVGKGGRCL